MTLTGSRPQMDREPSAGTIASRDLLESFAKADLERSGTMVASHDLLAQFATADPQRSGRMIAAGDRLARLAKADHERSATVLVQLNSPWKRVRATLIPPAPSARRSNGDER